MSNYGLPYKGSKNKIAKEIVDFLPEAEHFYDLFAGGCAMTHAAMLSGKWQTFTINDIDDGIVTLFQDAVAGKYSTEDKWISRETFELLKSSDPYIRFCWSFGNNGRSYLYAPEIERFKKHLHAIFFSKTPHEARLHWRSFVREFALVRKEIEELTEKVTQLCQECNVELPRNPDGTVNCQKIKADVFRALSFDIRKYMRDALKESGRTAADVDKLLGTNGMASHYFGSSQWLLPTAESYEKMQTIIPGLTIPWSELNESLESLERLESLESLQSLERLESLQRLESLESLQSLESLERLQSLESLQSLERLESLQRLESLERLQSLERLERLQRLESLERLQRLQKYSGDYQDVPIEPGGVIYCDIPYYQTSGYGKKKNDFGYERFYKWACEQTVPVYISEYWMPEDRFECVWERQKTSSFGTGNGKKTIEKLFIPRRR